MVEMIVGIKKIIVELLGRLISKLSKGRYVIVGSKICKSEVKNKIIKWQSSKLPLKIIIGSSGTIQEGWISTEQKDLDMLNEDNWKSLFSRNSISAILAEHVWEHLTLEDGALAAKHCFEYLKKGGYIRIAVPDGLHRDEKYINMVKPNGTGYGSDDHKVLYNYINLSQIFIVAGFEIHLLEYFDENGQFHFNKWEIIDGKILRSMRYDGRNNNNPLAYTSIILDAYK